MNIKAFIQNHILQPRLKKAGVLVIYDPERRYRELCVELSSEKTRVVDASESSITGRAEALAALQAMGQPHSPVEALLIYVPAKAPVSDEEKQVDPFAIYCACGAVFPDSDGDEYQSLCLKARPDQVTEIRRIFQQDPNPSFAVIDAVGGAAGWPILQGLLGVDSARSILIALLEPSEQQKEALKDQDTWVEEAKALFASVLDLRLQTRAKTWNAISDELWRFLLYSEFVFDLPESLPAALVSVPRAPQEARLVVEDLCEGLRSDRRTQDQYIERAEGIEQELNLPALCRQITNLGVRDTFPFEERSFFSQAVEALRCDAVDQLRAVLNHHQNSIWTGRGENRDQWQLMQSAASLVEACEDAARQLPDYARSQETLIDYYIAQLREVDRLQREFEQAAGGYYNIGGDAGQATQEVIVQARKAYRQLADKAQNLFIRHLEKTGWPPAGRLANADVFDKLVAPKLQESGRRVALLLIDALRYELGVELARLLGDDNPVETQAAFAQLPTITPVGMASLLPGAGQSLCLVRKEDGAVPILGDQPLATVTQRMEVLRKFYGQRFAEFKLDQFVRGRVDLPGTVELLVLRSNEMDNQFESDPETAPSLISHTFQQIRGALHKLRGLGFRDAIISTDHGFFLNSTSEAGDGCAKPNGSWVSVHDRMLLGDGLPDAGSFVLSAEALGIRSTDFHQVAGPRALVTYKAGAWYFHGGISLQEAVVPVIAVSIRVPEREPSHQLNVTLSYRRESRKITTRLPVIEVKVESQASLFAPTVPVEILLEAQDEHGKVVGEARLGGPVNAATHTVHVNPGETVQVTMKMEMDYEGIFWVKAFDPNTMAALGKALELETDYTI